MVGTLDIYILSCAQISVHFMKLFNCLQLVLSFSCQYTSSLSPTVKQQMQQQQQCWDYSFYTCSGWQKFSYVTITNPPETRRVTYKLHPQERSCFVFFYTFGTPHTRHIHGCHFFLFSFFLLSFWCCYERNSFHTALLSHFISLVHPAHHLFFLSSREWLLDSHKCRLHATNDEPQLAHWRQQSVGSAFQFHYTLL